VKHQRAAATLDSIKQRSQQLDLGDPTKQRPKVACSNGHQRTIFSAPMHLQKRPPGKAAALRRLPQTIAARGHRWL